MNNSHKLYRPCLTAIAAVLALSTTPAFAQDATAVPDPLQAAPASEPAEETTAPDPLAPSAEAEAQPAATATTTARTRAARRPATPRPATLVAAAAPAAVAAAAEAAPAAPLAELPAAPIAAAPVAAAPPPAPAPAETAQIDEEMLPIAGAAGLGILGLLGAGLAVRRRRRRETDAYEPVEHQEPGFARTADPLPAPSPPAATPSAFAWGSAAPAAKNHIEAAYAGPTPDNPSLSLKKRLRRAAFFEQRERMAAAGEAAMLPRDAGLPAAAIARTERVAKPARPARPPMAWGYGMTFQPA